MAKYNKSADSGYINVSFTGHAALAKEELVEIVSDFEVDKPSAVGSIKIVGEVVVPCDSSGEIVTIGTFYTKLRTYVTGAAVAVGAVVLDANNDVINYVNPTHDPASIIGLAIEAADASCGEINCLVR